MGTLRIRRRRVVIGLVVAVVLVLLAAVGSISWRMSSYDNDIQRIEGAMPTESDRPTDDPGENWLLVGSDMRGESTAEKWRTGEARSDVIMLLHVPKEERRAYIISIPRDAWVEIPGHGKAKINDSFREGGPRLLTRTVEELGEVHVDHFAAIDFNGFKEMTDALGGVDVYLKEDVYDPSNGWSWPAGHNRMDGDEALRFVRERKGLPRSDRDRIKRQQAFLKAMGEEAASSDVARDPAKLDAFLKATSKSLAVDDGASIDTLRALALRLRDVGPDRVMFASLPAAGTDWIGDKNVLRLDEDAMDGMFTALREDRLSDHIEKHDLENDIDKVR